MEATDGGYGTSQLPLAGAVLCCTSIAPEQRAQLAAIGSQMGATIKLDLTSDVTHLIVGSTDSAKYRYVAKSREDVKVLSPEWLGALNEVWLRGDDNVDVAALEKEYRMPTFFGLKMCLTGYDDPEQRRSIQQTVDANGAEYHGDLTKTVTHLLAATPSGKKYEHALNWRMKIVSLEWFEQSLERGMVLDEALYNPTMAVEERGRGAWDRRLPTSPALGKRIRDAEPSQALNPFRRKLRRSASTKMGTQSDALWAGITAVSMERQQEGDDDWTEDVSKQDSTRGASTRTQTPASPEQNAPTDQDDAPTEPHLADPAESHEPSLPPHANQNPHQDHDGIFEGRIVCPHGFDVEKTGILREHLESKGARVLRANELNNPSLDDLRRGYFVIPHDAEVDLADLPERAGSLITVVTNWWVERCLYGKRLVDPADDVLSRPFESFSISGFSGLTINSTGFAGIELLHVTKVVTLMGATYDEQFTAKTSVIICNPPAVNAAKLKFATGKRIPAVTPTWLWECLRSGRLQSYGEYQLNKPAPPQAEKTKQRLQRQDNARTVPVSEAETDKTRQKKPQAVNIVTKPQVKQRPQKPGALNLAPSAQVTPASTKNSVSHAKTNPNDQPHDDDEPAIDGYDGAASYPLQGTTGNSRPSTSSSNSKPFSRPRSSSAESLIAPGPRNKSITKKQARAASPDSVIPNRAPDSVIPAEDIEPAPLAQEVEAEQQEEKEVEEEEKEEEEEEEKDYSDILAQLRRTRAALPTPDQTSLKHRKRRQLGRATSTRSTTSANSSSANLLNLGDGEADEGEGESEIVLKELPQPSQTLGWDEPGAAKKREDMIRKLGGTVREGGVVAVEGIGVVRDVVPKGEGTVGRGRKRRG